MRSLRSSFHRRLRQRDESGAALIAVTILIVVLTSIIAVTTSNAINDLNRATKTERRNAAYSAAEAGVADYVAKVTEDPTYFLRFVHPAESTRRSPGGFTAVGASSWNGSLAWSYPSPNNLWRALPNGFEYNLEIVPPATGLTGVKIIATGRKTGSPNDWRKLEAVVRPASVADFSFISNGDQSFGTGATTDGKMYVGVDSSGIAHDLNHRGNAYGSLFAEGQVVGMDASRLHNGAETFDSDSDPSIRSVVPTALNFNLFTNSLIDIKAAASGAGLLLDQPGLDAWRLTFNADSTVTVERCTRSWGTIAEGAPICVPFSSESMPANGAIWSEQTVIVRGVVKGRVTVATNYDVVIGEDVLYADPDQDVLGLVARENVLIAYWAPNNLTVSASMIAQNGSYRSVYSWLAKSGTFHHLGSGASNIAGFMTMFATRNYEYDTKLLLYPPPFFPTFGDAYTIVSFRELTP